MILLWLAVPFLLTAVAVMVIARNESNLDEVERRERAMKRLEAIGGSQGLSNDDDRRAGWFVDQNDRWPRRVRVIRRPTNFTGPHEPWTGPQEASADEG